MGLFELIIIHTVLSSRCINFPRIFCTLNFSDINHKEISVETSVHPSHEEHNYTPKSRVEIYKVVDGVNVIWEDRLKLTQCILANTITKNNLIHLIHLEIKRTSTRRENNYYKRVESKFVSISQDEYENLKSATHELADNAISFDINNKTIDSRFFKSSLRPIDGVTTLLLEPLPPYKLLAVYDDSRTIWSRQSTQMFVENLIAYYLFDKYYLVMLKLNVDKEDKYPCFAFRDFKWIKIEYQNLMYLLMRFKSYIPITGYLSFDVLDLPDNSKYSVEKSEKYGIEIYTFYPSNGYRLYSVLKGQDLIWESATERCVTLRLVKKKDIVHAIKLSLIANNESVSTAYFIFDGLRFKLATEDEFKSLGRKLVDTSVDKKHDKENNVDEQSTEEGSSTESTDQSQQEEEGFYQPFNIQQIFDVDIVTKINSEQVLYTPGSKNGVSFVEVSLKDPSFGINSVSHDGKLMWKSSKGDFLCKHCFIYYFNDIPQLLKLVFLSQSNVEWYSYKHVSNGEWVDIEHDIFYKKLESFESLSKPNLQDKNRLFKLDTSNFDTSLVKFTTVELDNLTFKQYRPIGNTRFHQVYDLSLIWKSESDFLCSLVRIYFSGTRRVLCKLFLSNGFGFNTFLCFVFVNEKWREISSREFEARFFRYNTTPPRDENPYPNVSGYREHFPGHPTPNKMYINNPDSRFFTVVDGVYNNVPYTLIKSNSNVSIHEVLDHDSTLWSKTGDSHCTHFKFYKYRNNVVLAELIAKSAKSKMLFFRKAENGWEQIDEDYFNEMYQLLLKRYKRPRMFSKSFKSPA